MSRKRTLGLATAALGALALACMPPPPPRAATPPPVSPETAAITIVAPEKPLPVPVVVRAGSFTRSHASQVAVKNRFGTVLDSARVFTDVLDAPRKDGKAWDLQLSAADYGEEQAYTFELKALLLRGKELAGSYVAKQSARQERGQVTIGPEQLGQLAERAIRDLVRQIAADTERLSKL